MSTDKLFKINGFDQALIGVQECIEPKLVYDIDKIAEDIRENKFSSNVGHHCEYCEFKDLICPEFN